MVYVLGGMLFYSGCSRVEEMARRNDEDANIRLAVGEIGKQMEKAGKGLKRLEDFLGRKFRKK